MKFVMEKKIKMKFEDYITYAKQNHDEDPIYMFDPEFGKRAKDLLTDYTVPKYFQEDLFSNLGKRSRPLYRWFVLGPERSGSPFHLDPYKTSAWNALLVGRKRWMLYPPGVVPPGVDDEIDSDGEHDYDAPEPMKYYTEVYPTISNYSGPQGKPIECILEAGEMIYVPTGWWHMVLNLSESIAVTQNVMNSQNFKVVYEDVKKDDRKMKHKLKKRLKKRNREIYDKFLSHSSRRHKKKAEKEPKQVS